MEYKANLPICLFEEPAHWRDWLRLHYAETAGLWLKIAKKDSGMKSVSYAEALDEALCYGWIDGQKSSYDAAYYLQKFTPRRMGSMWSKVNVLHAERLINSGQMEPAGLAAIEAAKQDGRWEAAYDSPSASSVPPDFQAALNKNPAAKAYFSTLNKANTYAFCWRIQTAKKPETRQARIEKFITMLANGEKLH